MLKGIKLFQEEIDAAERAEDDWWAVKRFGDEFMEKTEYYLALRTSVDADDTRDLALLLADQTYGGEW